MISKMTDSVAGDCKGVAVQAMNAGAAERGKDWGCSLIIHKLHFLRFYYSGHGSTLVNLLPAVTLGKCQIVYIYI